MFNYFLSAGNRKMIVRGCYITAEWVRMRIWEKEFPVDQFRIKRRFWELWKQSHRVS